MYFTPTISLPIPSAYAIPDYDGGQLASLTVPVLRGVVLGERALGVGGESSSTSNVLPMSSTGVSGTETTSSSPFFTTVSSAPGSDNGSSNGGSGNLTKTVLEWVFAIAALVVIASLTIWRYAKLRRNRQPMHAFLPHGASWSGYPSRPLNVPRTTGLPRVVGNGETQALSMSAALFYPPSLSNGRYPATMEPLPAVIASATGANERGRGRRAARGTDIDAHGRRTGARDADDDDGGDDKDELPAYDNLGGPPKYVDLHLQAEMQLLGMNGTPIPLRVLRARLPDASTETPAPVHEQTHSPDIVTHQEVMQTVQTEHTTPDALHDLPPPFHSPIPSRPSSPPNMSPPHVSQPQTNDGADSNAIAESNNAQPSSTTR